MNAYKYQIGKGSTDNMSKVVFSEDLFADSLGEAIDKAKAVTRIRPAHSDEDMVQIIDASQPDGQVVWARSAEEIRDA